MKIQVFARRALPVCFFLYLVSLTTSISGMELFSCLLFFFMGIDWWFNRANVQWQWPPFSRPILVFIAIAATSILVGNAPTEGKFYDLSRLRFFFIYAGLFYYLKMYPPKWEWIRVIAWCSLIIGAYGVVQHFIPIDLIRPEGKKVILFAIPDEKIGPLVIGTFNHHLTFSNVFLLYAPILLALGILGNKIDVLSLFVGGVLLLVCIWTQSRAAWIGVSVIVVVLSYIRNWKVGVTSTVALSLLFGLLFMKDDGFRQRIDRTLFQKSDVYNLGPRKRLWVAQWEMFKEHPVLGVGYNNNERLSRTYVDRLFPDAQTKFYGHAHSVPLQILATTGILGSIAFFWLWASMFSQLWRKLKTLPRKSKQRALTIGLLLALSIFHVLGLTQWNFGDAEVAHNLMFLWAVIATLVSDSPTNQADAVTH